MLFAEFNVLHLVAL